MIGVDGMFGDGVDVTPNPPAWPECSRCGVPYVLRRGHSVMSGKAIWATEAEA